MTLDEQFELLAKFYQHLLIAKGSLYEGFINPGWGCVNQFTCIEDVTFTNNLLYINHVRAFNLFLTEQDAMEAVYYRLNSKKDLSSDIVEAEFYNKCCEDFKLPLLEIPERTYEIVGLKSKLQFKSSQLQQLTTEVATLKDELKKLGEPV